MFTGDTFTLFVIGAITALATGLGAIPVFLIRQNTKQVQTLLTGLTVGMMSTAAIIGLLKPAWELGDAEDVVIGFSLGGLFVLTTRYFLGLHHDHSEIKVPSKKRSLLMFVVLFVHSIPEGFALGTGYASEINGLALFVILAIALQNIPEGMSMAIPMREAGFSASRQFWAGVLTSSPQPVCAVVAFVLVSEIESLLPFSFAFAAGAMLVLVVVELIPGTYLNSSWRYALVGTGVGIFIIAALSAVIGV